MNTSDVSVNQKRLITIIDQEAHYRLLLSPILTTNPNWTPTINLMHFNYSLLFIAADFWLHFTAIVSGGGRHKSVASPLNSSQLSSKWSEAISTKNWSDINQHWIISRRWFISTRRRRTTVRKLLRKDDIFGLHFAETIALHVRNDAVVISEQILQLQQMNAFKLTQQLINFIFYFFVIFYFIYEFNQLIT